MKKPSWMILSVLCSSLMACSPSADKVNETVNKERQSTEEDMVNESQRLSDVDKKINQQTDEQLEAELSEEMATVVEESEAGIESNELGKDTMNDWQTSMVTMGGMLKNPDKFQLEVFRREASALSDSANQPWEFFTELEDDMNHEQEQAWATEIENFVSATHQLNEQAKTATDGASMADVLSAVGATCASCHSKFK